jgi:hypothetical protein
MSENIYNRPIINMLFVKSRALSIKTVCVSLYKMTLLRLLISSNIPNNCYRNMLFIKTARPKYEKLFMYPYIR